MVMGRTENDPYSHGKIPMNIFAVVELHYAVDQSTIIKLAL